MENPAMAMIDQFDIKSGWTSVPDPFAEEDNLDEAADRLGLRRHTRVGLQVGPSITLLSDRQRYVILFDTENYCERFLATDLPSAVELLSKLSPLVEASIVECLYEEFSDLRDLLVADHGPLQEAHFARNRQRRAEREKAQSAKAK